ELHADRAGRDRRAGASRVSDIRWRVEDADDPTPTRDRVLRMVEDLGGQLDRSDEQRDQEQKRDDATDRQVAGDTKQDADDNDTGGRDAGNDLRAREHRDAPDLRAGLNALVRRDRAVQPGSGAFFGGIRTDDWCTDNGLGDGGQ